MVILCINVLLKEIEQEKKSKSMLKYVAKNDEYFFYPTIGQ
jgi:hypothetical protein